MIIKDSGTINFWFDKSKNPMAFKEGANVFWTECKINNEHAVITTESKTLSVTMNPKTERELLVFQTSIEPDETKTKHMVTITWSPIEICLYFDAQLVQKFSVDSL